MPGYLDILLGKAFYTIPGEAYNRYRQKVEEGINPPKLFFELSLMEERPWAYLCDRAYPLFVRYVRAKRLDPRSGEGVVVAVFQGTRCHLLKGEAFLQVFQEMEGLDSAALDLRIKQWLYT